MLHRDCLGNLEARASVSVFGGNCGLPNTGGYLLLTTVSDYGGKGRKWDYVSRDVSHIVAELESDGWQCTVDLDGYNAPRIKMIHVETQAAIDDRRAQDNSKFANAKRGYIRFGALPKSGKSINHRDNTPEPGVSVFEADFVGKDYRVVLDNHILHTSYISVANRPAYRVYGKEVGTGADGEPCLQVSRVVRV